MKKCVTSFSLLLVAALMLGESGSFTAGASSETKDPQHLLNLLWLKKDSSAQKEKEVIQKSFVFQTQA